jgi:hypothetical protein
VVVEPVDEIVVVGGGVGMHFYELPVVVNPVDEIVVVGDTAIIHFFSYLWSVSSTGLTTTGNSKNVYQQHPLQPLSRRLDQLPQVTKQRYTNNHLFSYLW